VERAEALRVVLEMEQQPVQLVLVRVSHLLWEQLLELEAAHY
jgi:hypothetical protein